jgi:uncharacterized membrane protein
MFGAIVIIVLGCLVLPCLLPLVMWSISTLLEAMMEQKTAEQLYLLQGYQRVNPIDSKMASRGRKQKACFLK